MPPDDDFCPPDHSNDHNIPASTPTASPAASSPISVTPVPSATNLTGLQDEDPTRHHAPSTTSTATPLRLAFALEQRRMLAALDAARADAADATDALLQRARAEAARLDARAADIALASLEALARSELLDARETQLQLRVTNTQKQHPPVTSEHITNTQLLQHQDNPLQIQRHAATEYSAVDHAALTRRQTQIQAREEQLEARAKLLAQTNVALVAQQKDLCERELRLEQRTSQLHRRDKILRTERNDLALQKEALQQQIKSEKRRFWDNQQSLTAAVAAQVESLLTEHRQAKQKLELELQLAQRSLRGLLLHDSTP